MKCAREGCGHPVSAHYPDGCFASMWGGTCKVRCQLFVWPKKKGVK
jgi:hypothetical protein